MTAPASSHRPTAYSRQYQQDIRGLAAQLAELNRKVERLTEMIHERDLAGGISDRWHSMADLQARFGAGESAIRAAVEALNLGQYTRPGGPGRGNAWQMAACGVRQLEFARQRGQW